MEISVIPVANIWEALRGAYKESLYMNSDFTVTIVKSKRYYKCITYLKDKGFTLKYGDIIVYSFTGRSGEIWDWAENHGWDYLYYDFGNEPSEKELDVIINDIRSLMVNDFNSNVLKKIEDLLSSILVSEVMANKKDKKSYQTKRFYELTEELNRLME